MTAMNPSSAPKQQFILTTADGSGAGKVILASPDSHNTKQFIFTAADSLMPGRIQVHCGFLYIRDMLFVLFSDSIAIIILIY